MRSVFAFVSALLCATPAMAQTTPVPVMSDEEVGGNMGIGAELETRLDGDIDGDGNIDTVFVERGDDARSLSVMLVYGPGTCLTDVRRHA